MLFDLRIVDLPTIGCSLVPAVRISNEVIGAPTDKLCVAQLIRGRGRGRHDTAQ
jgi:hypothetical protein